LSALREYSSPLSHFEPTELLDTLSTGIVVLDGQLCPIYANVSAQDFMAVSLKQARGRPFADLFFDPRQLLAVLRRSLDRLETCTQHEISLKAMGSPAQREPHVIDLIVTPLEGQVTGTHLLVELADATQRQRISRDSDILTGMDGSRLMIRQLAHEVKNPLGGLRGAAQLLDKELADPALREYTAIIITEADRLTALVDSMAGSNGPPTKTQLNVHEMCEHVVRLISAEAPEDVQVDRDYDPSLPPIKLDRNQIIQAMLNLGRNAIQAIGQSGRLILRTRALTSVSIGTRRYRLVASIQFEDTGPGVPEHLRDTLFYPLVTGRAEGTGLGLAVAQDLVSRHDGLIEFTSRPGQTLFTILLPFSTSDADEIT